MAANVSIARRYARALVEASAEAGTLEKVHGEIESFVKLMDASADWRDVVQNPAYSKAQRSGILEHVIKTGGLTNETGNLLRLLSERNRLVFLPDIARIFRDLADLKSGRVRGKLTSARPLDPALVKSLEKSLEKATQRNVVLETNVDPKVLGGVAAQVGSVVYDGTLKAQLEDLRRTLQS